VALRGAQQAQPPLWMRMDEPAAAGAGVPTEAAPRLGVDISRGDGTAQSGHGAGWSDCAIDRHALNGPQSAHAYS
jgi:hypothetical protein